MSRIQINADQLEAFADQIGRAEEECDHALNAINWHLGSLAANFPGTMPASIANLEADFKYQINKYKHKLDDVQRLVKLTASSTRQSEQSLTGKVGGFLLELVGWYDIQRLAGEYDPVTGEKLSAGDKALAGLMLALTIFPPAKAVGVGGKAVSMGVKAGKGAAAKTGFSAIAKTPEVFKGIRNAVNTQKVQKAFKEVYNDVVVAPFSATRQWIANTAKAMGDVRIPTLGRVPETVNGMAFNQTTVREAFSGAKESIVKMAVETGDRWKGFVDKGTGNLKNVSDKDVYGPYYDEAKKLHENNPDWYPNPDESTIVKGNELKEARADYQALVRRGELEKGHHKQGLAFGGENVNSNIKKTGESTIRREQIGDLNLDFYHEMGYGKKDAKILKIHENEDGIILFGNNPQHTEVTTFQNKVLKWQREQGKR